MSPEDVFSASKIIKDLNDVQKKASSLCEKLKKEKRLSSNLKSDISRIDELDEMNETIKLYKEKKSSGLEKAKENGIENIIEIIRARGAGIDECFKMAKFKTKKDLVAGIGMFKMV